MFIRANFKYLMGVRGMEFKKVCDSSMERQVKAILILITSSVIYRKPFSVNDYSTDIINCEDFSCFRVYKKENIISKFIVNYKTQNYNFYYTNSEENFEIAFILSLCLNYSELESEVLEI